MGRPFLLPRMPLATLDYLVAHTVRWWWKRRCLIPVDFAYDTLIYDS